METEETSPRNHEPAERKKVGKSKLGFGAETNDSNAINGALSVTKQVLYPILRTAAPPGIAPEEDFLYKDTAVAKKKNLYALFHLFR